MQPTHLHNLTSVQYQSRCRTCCSSVAQPLTFSSLQITDCCFQPCLRIKFILSVSSRPSHSRSHSSHLAHDTSVTISCLLTAHFWLTTHFPQDCLWTWSRSPMLNLMSPSCIHWPWFPKNKWVKYFKVFERTVCKMVRPMLSDHCPVCLPVTLGYYGQTAGWIKIKLGMEVGLDPSHIVSDGDPAPYPRKGHSSLFSAHVYCGKTVAHLSYCWILCILHIILLYCINNLLLIKSKWEQNKIDIMYYTWKRSTHFPFTKCWPTEVTSRQSLKVWH